MSFQFIYFVFISAFHTVKFIRLISFQVFLNDVFNLINVLNWKIIKIDTILKILDTTIE